MEQLQPRDSLVNGAYKINNIVGTIDKEACGDTVVGVRRFIDLKEITSGHLDVALGRIPNRTDIGKTHRGHLIGAPHIINILMHPRIEHMLVLIVAQIEHEIRGDQHKVGELVALARITATGQLVGEPAQASARHQYLNLIQCAANDQLFSFTVIYIDITIDTH